MKTLYWQAGKCTRIVGGHVVSRQYMSASIQLETGSGVLRLILTQCEAAQEQ